MGHYLGSSCKICRRNAEKLFLKGERCKTAKCALEKRNYPPGYRKLGMGRKPSEYGIRLREKQKLRFFYRVSEKQMRRSFAKATTQKGITGHNLISLFERRLDNIIFRSALALSRREARQLIGHGCFLVNSKRVDIASFIAREGDIISVKKEKQEFFKKRFELAKEKGVPSWMLFEEGKNEIKVAHSPKREEVDIPVEEQLIVEYYSR